MALRRVVITGLGLVTSLAEDVDIFWKKLLAGESGIRPIQRFDASPLTTRIGGEVTSFDPEHYFQKRAASRMDRFAQMALAGAQLAVADAGIDFSSHDVERCGVIVGSGIGGLAEFEDQHNKALAKGADRVSPLMVPKLMINAASGHISILWGLKGPNSAIASACASAANAIGEAFKIIQDSRADVMITGGSEAALTLMGLAGFCAMRGALSKRNDEPCRASRPFDADRDGFVLSEGAGVVVMEEYELAKARGAPIYAEMVGYGMSGDGHHIVQPDPLGRGAVLAMEHALSDAGVQPESVDYINAHGTATPLGDVAETKAIKHVFGKHAHSLAVSSTKSSLGHLLGASGGVELIATCLALRDNVAPPTINLETPDPQCDLDYVPLEAREMKIDCAMTNSFGFGGHNASLLLHSV
ncbi:MAG: beta-ketoacyl-ACP synthase II [Planctomycetia bacterium]|nr:beta-ketoacyl-ACP synthase II [Planctomycetia bacterium]